MVKEVKKTIKKAKVATEQVKLSAPLLDLKGIEIGTVELSSALFGAAVNDRLVAQYARVFLANNRQGTASTKTRSEVSGTTKKVYRQKGTGRARHGSAKAPTFVGGGVVHAPKPRDYSLKMNTKQRQKAFACAITSKFKANEIIFVEGFDSLKGKTKEMATALKNLKLNMEKKNLVVVADTNIKNISMASRNISKLSYTPAAILNAYQILANQKIVLDKSGLAVLEKKVN
jgi:large subunit ribosomal protein L4